MTLVRVNMVSFIKASVNICNSFIYIFLFYRWDVCVELHYPWYLSGDSSIHFLMVSITIQSDYFNNYVGNFLCSARLG